MFCLCASREVLESAKMSQTAKPVGYHNSAQQVRHPRHQALVQWVKCWWQWDTREHCQCGLTQVRVGLACYFSCSAFFSVLVGYRYKDLETIICVVLFRLARWQSHQDCSFLYEGAVSTLLPRVDRLSWMVLRSLRGRQAPGTVSFNTPSFPPLFHPIHIAAFTYYPQLHFFSLL